MACRPCQHVRSDGRSEEQKDDHQARLQSCGDDVARKGERGRGENAAHAERRGLRRRVHARVEVGQAQQSDGPEDGERQTDQHEPAGDDFSQLTQ